MSERDTKNPNLKHNKALYEKRLIFGVPSKLFVLAGAIVVICIVSTGFIAGLVAIFMFVIPLIMVHRNDDQAFLILINKLRRPTFYTAGGVDEKKLKVVKKHQDKLLLGDIKDVEGV